VGNFTRSYYDTLAQRYDGATSGDAWTPNQILRSDLAVISDTLYDVLDLGAGTGQTSATLAHMYPAAHITAVDFSLNMLGRLAEKVPRARVIGADLESFVADDDREYDLITAIGCLEFLPRLPRLLRKVAKLLRPGGLLCFTYEPLIAGFSAQGKARSVGRTPVGRGAGLPTTYRHTPHTVERTVCGAGAIEASGLFVAYRRRESPVIYHYVRLRRGA
jgi:predicted TPR repeat methyltransferase